MGDCAAAKRPRKETSDRDAVLEGITQIVRTYFADAKIVEKIVSEEEAFNATSESVQALFFVKKTSTSRGVSPPVGFTPSGSRLRP